MYFWHKGPAPNDRFLLGLGKPGKQKTQVLWTGNHSQAMEDFDEDWSISNALCIHYNHSRIFVLGGYDDVSGSLFKSTLQLDQPNGGGGQWIEANVTSSVAPQLKLPRDMAAIGNRYFNACKAEPFERARHFCGPRIHGRVVVYPIVIMEAQSCQCDIFTHSVLLQGYGYLYT